MNRLNRKFRIWEGLIDSSFYFALAGMKARGLSTKEAKARLKKRWQRAQAEHHRANLKVIKRLYGQRD